FPRSGLTGGIILPDSLDRQSNSGTRAKARDYMLACTLSQACSRGLLRHDPARTAVVAFSVENSIRESVVVLTYVFEQFEPLRPSHGETARPRRGVGAGIIDGHFILQRPEIDARQAFDQVEPVGMRQSVPVHPKHFIETDRVHDQGIPFPVADGVPVVAGFQLLRMSPSI